MSFYVNQAEMIRLSGRTKQNLHAARKDERLPFLERGPIKLYDIDDSGVQDIIKDMPKNVAIDKRDATIKYRENFLRKRAKGEILCALTKEPDKEARADAEDFDIDFTTIVKTAEDDDLDRIKKEEEILKLRGHNEKQGIQIKALTGGLIEREYVATWVNRYLGTFHTLILEYAMSGRICDELYNIAMREKDSRTGVKKMETALSVGLSDLVKGSSEVMQKNPV